MATDFLTFNEGTDHVLSSGMPATCHFLLSTDNVAALSATSTLAGGVGEITGTGYGRTSQSLPTPTAGDLSFTPSTWTTGSATDWPASVCSIILATTSDNSGVAIAAWNLVPGGAGRDLSHASTTEVVTPTLTTESVDMSFASTVASAGVTSAGITPAATLGTTQIMPTATSLVDAGSNLFDNGTFKIYLVPETGIYEITANFNIEPIITGGTQVIGEFGYAVGSSSSGTASDADNFVLAALINTGEVYNYTTTSYEALTAGQYVNLIYKIDTGPSAVTLNVGGNVTNLCIQRIA